MTRLFTDGAEMGDILSVPSYYSDTNPPAIQTAIKRSGAYSYKLASTTGAARTICLMYSFAEMSEIYFRFGFYTSDSTRPHTAFVGSGNITPVIQMKLVAKRFNAYVDGTLVAGGGIDIENDTWCLVEGHFKIADAGSIQTKIDGILDIDYSGDTKPGAGTTFDRFYYGFVSVDLSALVNNAIDDIAINDTAGAVDNSWCGDGHVIALTPNANGDSFQLVGSDANSTDNYLLVDEVPSDGDTTYVESATADEQDLYNLTACGLTNVNILRVWAEARAKDTTTGTGTVKLLVKTEATEYESANIDLTTSYAKQQGAVYAVNPNTSAAWTTAQLDALQVGMKVVD